jgi:hypothetical protein
MYNSKVIKDLSGDLSVIPWPQYTDIGAMSIKLSITRLPMCNDLLPCQMRMTSSANVAFKVPRFLLMKDVGVTEQSADVVTQGVVPHRGIDTGLRSAPDIV